MYDSNSGRKKWRLVDPKPQNTNSIMSQMQLQTTIFVGIFILMAQSDGSCPCFSDRTLDFLNIDNIANDSCIEDPSLGSLYIWEIRDPDIWHPHGYGIDINYLHCLQEGDMIRTVSQEQADTCMGILRTRCNSLKTLLGEVKPNVQIEPPISIPLSCPCFNQETLNLIANENISDDSCIESPDNIGNLYVWEKEYTNTWNPYGIGVELPHLSCFEGDILRDITQEESELCMILLRARCKKLGFLQVPSQTGRSSILSVLARHISMIFQHRE